MPSVTIELPENVLSALRRSPSEFAREMRLAAAIHWYARGVVSQERAASIAGLMLTTEALIHEVPEKEKAPSMPHGGGMGGMY